MKKRLVQFLLILSQAMFLFCADYLCEAMNALYSLGATAYTDEVVWEQGRSSVLIEDENEKSTKINYEKEKILNLCNKLKNSQVALIVATGVFKS